MLSKEDLIYLSASILHTSKYDNIIDAVKTAKIIYGFVFDESNENKEEMINS